MAKKKNDEFEKPDPERDECVEVEQKENEEQKDPKDEQIEKLQDQLLRQMAEYDNYRKRTAKERLDLEPEVVSKVVTKFLPVIDNLQRALAADCTDPNYKKGVEMISDSFMATLESLGVTEIKTDGEDFDPSLHQAVQQVQSDELESGKIAETFQKGYRIGEKIIRFPMVAVVS